MLIGFDLVKCLCDLLDNKVEYSDVVLIVTCVETDFRNDKEWTEFWLNQVSPINIFTPTHSKQLYHYKKTDTNDTGTPAYNNHPILYMLQNWHNIFDIYKSLN